MGTISNATSTGQTGQIDQTEFVSVAHQGSKIRHESGDNSVTDHSGSQQPSNHNPLDGGREVTKPSHDDIERMTDERLMSDPEYRELKEKLEMCGGLEDMFLLIDQNVGIANNRIICLDDILALVNDVRAPNQGAREAAKWLNDHRAVWAAIAKDDNVVGLQDVKDFIAGMKSELKGMKDTARADIKAENGIQTGTPQPATGTSGAAATAAQTDEAKKAEAKAVMAEADHSLPKPAPSEFSGLEGASENMNNMIGWGESEIDRLTSLMGKTDDPAVLKQLENKINQMSRRMQQMTALMNQLMTAMQNISKMYSDIAMNSVRNIR